MESMEDVPGAGGGRTHADLKAAVHPLVLLNISDHYTRVHFKKEPLPVVGILLGTKHSETRCIDISHSFEIVSAFVSPAQSSSANPNATGISIDLDFISTRAAQFEKIFPKLDVIGWYIAENVAQASGDSDLCAQQRYTEIQKILSGARVGSLGDAEESSVVLLVAPGTARVKAFESGAATGSLLPIEHELGTEASERVAVTHVAKDSARGENDHIAALGTLQGAVAALGTRLDGILARLVEIQSSQKPLNPEECAFLREVATVMINAQSTSDAKEPEVHAALKNQYVDTMTITYLSALTRALCDVHEIEEGIARSAGRGGVGSPRQRRSGLQFDLPSELA